VFVAHAYVSHNERRIVVTKNLVMLAVIALSIAACGGGESVDTPSSTAAKAGDTQPPATQSAPSTTIDAETEEPASSSGGEGTGTAMVGDTSWEFELLDNDGRSLCMMDGFVLVSMFGTDDEGREVNLTISGPAGGGEAVVTAGDATIQGERWVADAAVYDSLSGIEGMPDGVGATVQVDGNSVSGTGVFYEDRRLNEVRQTGDPYDAGALQGTFEATCPSA
jgi:hypothetical protein